MLKNPLGAWCGLLPTLWYMRIEQYQYEDKILRSCYLQGVWMISYCDFSSFELLNDKYHENLIYVVAPNVCC
jgi:hypothetical protein